MRMRTCVDPAGMFRYRVHRPSYRVHNLRRKDHPLCLGKLPDGSEVDNRINFPEGDLEVKGASTVYEIPNAFPFRGTTYIDSAWADAKASDPLSVRIASPAKVSMTGVLDRWSDKHGVSAEVARTFFQELPLPVLLSLATTSTDPEDLKVLARLACDFTDSGLAYKRLGQKVVPVIHDHDLFEAVGNNPYLPDDYKKAMLLRPGAQGPSEVVGDSQDQEGRTLVFEYLRRNSYIPWGHYASNMSHEAVRYRAKDLSLEDMHSLRHLYYQRTFVRLADQAGLDDRKSAMSVDELEDLRLRLLKLVRNNGRDHFLTCSLWGWNFGFDFSPTGYRMHGSHQQVHQQHALIPGKALSVRDGEFQDEQDPAFGAGDMVAEVVAQYREESGQDFFQDYVRCLRSNRRMDGRSGEQSLVVHEDHEVILFVPKAQLSQWELQLMPLSGTGNILEADKSCRQSLDRAILLALQILEGLGARMVTSIEYPKRFTEENSSQRLLYSFLPRLPWSPGSFSEAQHRFICGHYPEDFATACRNQLILI